jgi:hypothetical protein
MPVEAHRGLALILVAKLLRKRVPDEARDAYEAYADSPEVRQRANLNKKKRGRKVITSAQGDIYDLDEIYDRINLLYFAGTQKKPRLTWSARKTYRILGHHDDTHDTIVISRSLDAPDVPLFVVEYVVFHEMLHIHHPTQHLNGRRRNHTPTFRRDERKFRHYQAAEDWIESNVTKLKRRARQSRPR